MRVAVTVELKLEVPRILVDNLVRTSSDACLAHVLNHCWEKRLWTRVDLYGEAGIGCANKARQFWTVRNLEQSAIRCGNQAERR